MFKNLFYSLVTKGTVALINFFILIVSSRYLGVSSRGEISIFILNITIIQIINEIYTGYSIVHFIPKFDLKKIIVYGICFSLVFCSLSNLLVCVLNKQAAGYEWTGYLITLLVILNSFNCMIILGKEHIKLYNILSFIQPFVLLLGILSCIFIRKKFTFEAYIFPLLFSFAIGFIISTIYVFRFIKSQKDATDFKLKPILINGLVFQITSLMYIFINRYSYYLLPDIANVGLYASSSSFMEALLIIVNSISPVLLARVANQGDTTKSVEMTLVLSKASFIFTGLGVLSVFLLPDTFFVFVLGNGFSGIKKLMMLYAPGVLLVSIAGSINYYFSAIGKQKLVLVCYFIGFVFTLLFAPVLIRKFDNAGAAYSATIAYFLVTLVICVVFIKTNKLSLKRFFSFTTDYKVLKTLFQSEK